MEDKQEKKVKPPQPTLILRVVGGGYLLYLAYDLLKQWTQLDTLLKAAAILFALVGGVLVTVTVKQLVTNEYFYTPFGDEKNDSEEPEKTDEPEA